MSGKGKLIRTILVDDDIAMLKGLETIVAWEDEGFEIVGKVENGRDALRLVHAHAVDLMICDITMPGKDGLELTREAKAVSPGIKSIILTCHDEFPFAREAVAVRADDYLVKYTLTKEELTASLARVRQQIEVERDSKSKVVRAERALAESRYSLLRRFSQELVQAAERTDAGDTASRAEQLGVTLPPSRYVAIGFFAAPGSGELGFTRLEELVSQVADSVLLPISDTLDLMLYWGYHTKTQAAKELGQLFDAVASPASAADECWTISLADGFVNIAEIALAVERLKQLAAGAFYLRCGSILTEVPHFAETEAWDLFLPVRGDLRTALNTRDSETANSIIGALFDEFDQVRPAPEGVRGVIESILIDIGFVANDAKVKFPIDFRSFPRLDHHRAHLLETVRAFFAAVEANAAHSPRSDIERIKAYIDNHLAEPIGLDTICELVFMNKSYLSRLFKQEVGETFSEYLMRRRVEKAKRLLQSSERSIDEITEAIGLENVNHFYRIFKKVTGTTPGAFRK